MNLIITHHGTPLLVISSQAAPDAPPLLPPLATPGSLSTDPARGTLSLSAPADLFPQSVPHAQSAATAAITASGFPPEVLAHIRSLPGVWCVATDPTGLPLAEWPACNPGQAPDSVLGLLPDAAQHAVRTRLAAPTIAANASASPYALTLADGIHSVASANSWPPGAQHPAPQSVPPGIAAAHAALSAVSVVPYPPAGAFVGAVAIPLPPSPATSARLATAIDTLKAVSLNGEPVGAGLTGVLDWALTVHWSAATLPTARVTPDAGAYASFPAPPPCGWSPTSRTLFLSPDLPPALDAAWLAAGLYHAHVSLSGQSTASRLAASLLHPSVPVPDLATECSAAAAEAARAWILLAEILHALPGPESSAAALAAFASLPYGAEALSRFHPPASTTPPAYIEALNTAISITATDLVPLITPTIAALHAEATATRAAWHDPKRRASFPIPPRRALQINPTRPPISSAPATPTPSASPDPQAQSQAHAPQPYVAAGVIALPADAPPAVGYMAPSHAAHAGPLYVYLHPAAPTGAVLVDRSDGVRIIVNDIPAPALSALSAAKKATIIIYDLDGFTLTEPQPVAVAPYDDR